MTKTPLKIVVGITALLSSVTFAAAPGAWSNLNVPGNYQISYPKTWQVLKKGQAMVIQSPGEPGEHAVFGITPRAEGVDIQDAVNRELSDPDRSKDLQKAPARLGGEIAVKVWGSKKGDPSTRVVEYYVQHGSQQFYILFQMPRNLTATYSPIFQRMIGSMKFIQ